MLLDGLRTYQHLVDGALNYFESCLYFFFMAGDCMGYLPLLRNDSIVKTFLECFSERFGQFWSSLLHDSSWDWVWFICLFDV